MTDYTPESVGAGQINKSFGSIAAKSTHTAELSHTPSIGTKSVTAAVNSGLVVARASDGMQATDPAEYATDDAALQALVDWIETNHDEGTIHCPVRKADGSNLTIENTVSTSNTGATVVNFQFHGGRLSQSANESFVTTTINDGSPMFHIRGKTSDPYQALSAPTFRGGAWKLGHNDATILRMQFVNKPEISLGHVDEFHGDAVVLDTNVFEWRVHHTHFTPDDQQTTPTARCIVLENTLGAGDADDGTIAPSVSTETRHAEGFSSLSGATRPIVMGHWEGAAGIANVYCASGQLLVTPATTFQRTENGADHIRHEGGYASICPGHLGNTSGHGIHIPSGTDGPFRIWPYFTYNYGHDGDTIHVAADPGGKNPCVVPREDTIKNDSATVTYPSTPWVNVQYPDGYSIETEGTVTVSAGGSQDIWKYTGPGEATEIEWAIDADPGADVAISEEHRWGAADGSQLLRLIETTGNASVDVHYRVLTNKGFQR